MYPLLKVGFAIGDRATCHILSLSLFLPHEFLHKMNKILINLSLFVRYEFLHKIVMTSHLAFLIYLVLDFMC